MDDAVGGRRRIAAGDPGRQPVPGRDDAARAERRGDRRGQRLGQREDLRPGAARRRRRRRRRSRRGARRSAIAAARSMSRSSATGRCTGIGRASVSMTGGSAVWPSSMTSPCSPQKSRWVGRGVSANAARQAWRNSRGSSLVESTGVENLVTAAKSGACGDLLIGIAVLERRLLAAGQGDHRAAAEIGILQPGSEVGGADRLRHAHPGPLGDAGIAVGHIGRRLLRMGEHRLHAEIARAAAGCGACTDSTKNTCVMPVPANARASHSAPFIDPCSLTFDSFQVLVTPAEAGVQGGRSSYLRPGFPLSRE